jgi:hypothetical protein
VDDPSGVRSVRHGCCRLSSPRPSTSQLTVWNFDDRCVVATLRTTRSERCEAADIRAAWCSRDADEVITGDSGAICRWGIVASGFELPSRRTCQVRLRCLLHLQCASNNAVSKSVVNYCADVHNARRAIVFETNMYPTCM